MPTPLYDALKDYAAQQTVRFHMPGHKGITLPAVELASLAPLDVTELPTTGNLYEAGAPFDEAQALWAEIFGFDQCQMLTGGSTMGIHAGLSLFCRPRDRVLVDRGCHRAVYHLLALLDVTPVFLERPWLEEESIVGEFLPSHVEKILGDNPDIKTVCITSPTYAGLLSDIKGISQVVHQKGGKLFVDGAHGAHLPFVGVDAFSGADGVVVSAHKTLPTMGQSALLLVNGVDPAQLRRMASVFGTSSPSYPMLASLDVARDWLMGAGREEYRRVAARVAQLRARFPSLGGGLPLDPTRLTLKVKDGPAFARLLEGQGIYPEMEDAGHVVLICTASDTPAQLDVLEQTLAQLYHHMGTGPKLPPPPLPQRGVSLGDAMFAPWESLPLAQCEGRIAACQLAPYPPGVPVVAFGEIISKKELSYFKKIGYNRQQVQVLTQ